MEYVIESTGLFVEAEKARTLSGMSENDDRCSGVFTQKSILNHSSLVLDLGHPHLWIVCKPAISHKVAFDQTSETGRFD